MRRAAFVMLIAAALALSGCGDQTPAQKARREAVKTEEKARRALMKAAPTEWDRYRNNGVSSRKTFRAAEFPNGGYAIEYVGVLGRIERDALIQAAPAEWDAYIAAHNAANIARRAMWTALTEAESALQDAASGEWEAWEAALIAERTGKAAKSAAAKSFEKAREAAETALKEAAPEQWKTYKAALSEVKKLGRR